ncbi:ATP-binding protein [Acrocarpospora catenulata]|uniref:ATP-binding protein n=1 Tax=Acrocarpospora catenulata TaxID=2836182 RepID=UPI00355857BD
MSRFQGDSDDAARPYSPWASTPASTYRSRALLLPSEPPAVAVARRWIRKHLTRWALDELVDSCELLASELATNAIRHAADTHSITLLLMYASNTLRLEVRDSDATALPSCRNAEPTEEDGRGLALIENCADRWGVNPTVTGKSVWCELDTPRTGSPQPLRQGRTGGGING